MTEEIPPTCGKPVANNKTLPESAEIEGWSVVITVTAPSEPGFVVTTAYVCIREPNHEGDCSCAKVKYKDLVALGRALDGVGK